MITNDIPILQKASDCYKLFYQYSIHFPKKDRFGIGQQCEQQLLLLIRQIIIASKTSRSEKLSVLYDASATLDTIKILIRIMKELQIMDLKKYTALQEIVTETGRMLGGWIKSCMP